MSLHGYPDPLHRGSPGAGSAGGLPDAGPGDQERANLFDPFGFHRGATEARTPCPCSIEARQHTAPDHRSFQLGEDREHPEQRPACGRGGIEPLDVEIQADLPRRYLAQEANKVLKRSTQAADAPGRDQIELTSGYPLEERIVSRPSLPPLGTRDALVGEHSHDDPAETSNYRVNLTKLVLDRLPGLCADTGVGGDAVPYARRISRTGSPCTTLRSRNTSFWDSVNADPPASGSMKFQTVSGTAD